MSSVIAVRQDNDGDVLLMGPAIRALASDADRVTLLCGPRGVRAAELLPGIDEVMVHLAVWIDPEPPPLDRQATVELVDRLARLGPDRAVIFTSFHQSPLPMALLLRLAGVRDIAAISEDYPGSLLDVRHRGLPDDLHEVDRALSLVATLGYRLPPGDDGRLAVRHTARTPAAVGDRPYVVVHPGASVPARAWSPPRHAALVDELVVQGWRVVVTGSPDERALTAAVAGAARPAVVDLGGATTLAELAAVLAGASAVVVGNTGPAHLAAAVGTPVVSLFAPTVPVARWRPYGVPLRVLFRPVPCAGCRARICPVKGHPCIEAVEVGDVLDALASLLREEAAVREEEPA